jgi:hypothetical protein
MLCQCNSQKYHKLISKFALHFCNRQKKTLKFPIYFHSFQKRRLPYYIAIWSKGRFIFCKFAFFVVQKSIFPSPLLPFYTAIVLFTFHSNIHSISSTASLQGASIPFSWKAFLSLYYRIPIRLKVGFHICFFDHSFSDCTVSAFFSHL